MVERTPAAEVSVTVTAGPHRSRFRIPGQHAARRCLEPGRIAGQRDGTEGAYNSLHEHREPEEAVRQRIYTLDEDNALTVDFATHSMRVQSSGFPLPNFHREYATEEGLSFPGTFHRVAGTYECTTPPCMVSTVSTANDGMISSTGGTWTFTPDSDLADGIMIDLPDTDHLYFGWWLKEPDQLRKAAHAFRTFSGGTVPFAVGNKFTSGNTDGLLGTASYRGRAAGQYVTKDFSGGVLSGGTAGVFTATAIADGAFRG